MPPISRPLFDWSDDPARPSRARHAPGDVEDTDDVDDGEEDLLDEGSGVEADEDDPDADADAGADPDDAADDDDALDDEFPLGDGVAEDAATVWCPYCGEPSEVAVDPGGGAQQTYVEDCPVCCRPWRVTVSYQPDGSAHVWAQTDDD